MKRSGYVMLFSLFVLHASVSYAEDMIRHAVFPAPPFMIYEAERAQQEISGIDVDIVRELAKRLNLKVEYIECPWQRCLELMKSGDADILSSAYKKPEREEFMIYFTTPFLDKLPIAFYFEKNADISVKTYEDLAKLDSIGVLRGAGYFEQFDKDMALKKVDVASQDQLFPMLVNGRIQAIAGYVPTENYRIVTEGFKDNVKRSEYEYSEPANVYMAISKKSPFAARFEELNALNDTLFQEGVIPGIVKAYYNQYQVN